MRIERLDLVRYGAFAERRLAFSPDAALHVVFGRNEAGKTTTLEAIGDFLFGVDARTPYGFGPGGYGAMRIGAAIRFADGARLEALRRKGDKRTLVDADNKDVPDDRLLAALAGIKRETFEAEFGLSQSRLREGGKALARAGGKLSETLAAASASLTGLNAAQKRLDQEAGDLFSPDRRSTRKPLYEAIDRHIAAGKALRAATVDGEEWKTAQSALEQAKLRSLGLDEQRRALEAGVARRRRARRVRGKLGELAEAAERLEALGRAPEIPAATRAQARAALAAQAQARAALENLAAEDAQALRALQDLAVDEPLLGLRSAATALVQEIGRAKGFENDLPRRQADEEEARLRLDAIAAKLGLAGADELIARQPSDGELARAESLAQRSKRAGERRAHAMAARREAEAKLARLDVDRGAAADPGPLKRRLDSLVPALDEAKALAREEAALAREARAIAERAAALDPPVIDLDALARAALPDEATLAHRADAERAAEVAWRAAGEKRDAALAAAAAREAALSRLEAGGAVVTSADWEAARARREAALDRLAADPAGRTERLETARALTLAADAVAERLLSHSDRAARLQAARDEVLRAKGEARALAAACAQAEAARARESDATQALWRASGVQPGASARMPAWRRALAELLSRREQLESHRAEAGAIRPRVVAAEATLAAWLAEAGIAVEAPFEESHRRARDRLYEWEAAWSAAREAEIARRHAAEAVEALTRELADMDAEQAATLDDWPAAMARLGARPDASPEEAEAALAAWSEVAVPREKLRAALDRIDKIRIGLDAFAHETAAVAAAAPDLAGVAPLQAAAQIAERLAAAEKAAAERDRLRGEIGKRDARRAGIEAAERARGEALAALREALGAADDAGLAAALDRQDARDALAKTVDDLGRDLKEIGDGLSEPALRTELASFDPATLLEEITQAEEALKRFAEEFGAAKTEEALAQARLDALAAGRDAAAAAHQRAEAAGEIAELAELWLVRAAAAKLAQRAIERHRAAAQDPLIARAGELFRIATAASFEGLGVGYDKADQPILTARRAGAQTVNIDGLSEGACDQLFLSLRLALLERRAGEPIPFVGDDLLASFDDDRTRRTLELMAAFGAQRQTILFTHHARVAELASALRGVEVIEM